MGGSQDKTGRAVVEAPTAPGVWVVACLAVLVEGAIVRVFVLVTAGTVTVCSGEIFVFVAAFTQRQRVHAEERERGQVMMKPVSLRPACLFMAVLTLSRCAAVHILFLVTFGAAGSLRPAFTGDVARLARCFAVARPQCEICIVRVIEIDLFPGALTMAGIAFLTQCACMGVLKTMAAYATRF